ncbi:hypothetical protein EVAR_77592_1 [Eumeta japonica]|uniref:Uncharacterized protein n=1 Tax=Eumeta variegata TaxID=151549 RepID=A0A4C1T6P2_EUMVA|nr:hypothetical protein EVAR_77592_1 [Eumeta japonica]
MFKRFDEALKSGYLMYLITTYRPAVSTVDSSGCPWATVTTFRFAKYASSSVSPTGAPHLTQVSNDHAQRDVARAYTSAGARAGTPGRTSQSRVQADQFRKFKMIQSVSLRRQNDVKRARAPATLLV